MASTQKNMRLSFQAACAGLLGAFFLFVGIWSAALWVQFNPLYTDVACDLENVGIAPLDSSHVISQASHVISQVINGVTSPEVTINLQLDLKCRNPNAFSIELKDSKPAKVFIGDGKKDSKAQLKFDPGHTITAASTSSLSATIELPISPETLGKDADAFISLLATQVPVMIDFFIRFDVKVSFIFFRVGFNLDFDQACGFRLAGLGNVLSGWSAGSTGPFYCDENIDSLEIEKIPLVAPDSSSIPQMKPTKVQQDQIDNAERMLDICLLATMGIAFSLGVAFLFISCFWLFKGRRMDANHNGGDDKITAGKTSKHGSGQLDIVPTSSGGMSNCVIPGSKSVVDGDGETIWIIGSIGSQGDIPSWRDLDGRVCDTVSRKVGGSIGSQGAKTSPDDFVVEAAPESELGQYPYQDESSCVVGVESIV